MTIFLDVAKVFLSEQITKDLERARLANDDKGILNSIWNAGRKVDHSKVKIALGEELLKDMHKLVPVQDDKGRFSQLDALLDMCLEKSITECSKAQQATSNFENELRATKSFLTVLYNLLDKKGLLNVQVSTFVKPHKNHVTNYKASVEVFDFHVAIIYARKFLARQNDLLGKFTKWNLINNGEEPVLDKKLANLRAFLSNPEHFFCEESVKRFIVANDIEYILLATNDPLIKSEMEKAKLSIEVLEKLSLKQSTHVNHLPANNNNNNNEDLKGKISFFKKLEQQQLRKQLYPKMPVPEAPQSGKGVEDVNSTNPPVVNLAIEPPLSEHSVEDLSATNPPVVNLAIEPPLSEHSVEDLSATNPPVVNLAIEPPPAENSVEDLHSNSQPAANLALESSPSENSEEDLELDGQLSANISFK
ncbi:MAG: hypothetical protein WC785_00780 [Tatlockia sp.]|jgi:hypothetical protein